MGEPLLLLFGMARRAGRLALGTEASKQAVRDRKAHMIFIAADLAQRTERDLVQLCGERLRVLRLPYNIDTVSQAVGKKTGIITVCDGGFAKRARELYETANQGGKTI